ncbi:UDP-N-acetylmuramate--L-alanine ligase [Sunxiuqinia elliptica]|uniref:UDP-N-acetylmuramate--L-alanine ligase n=1 Tax=Sunxiuqinia elliptica TaxID=655355 RepID=A0A4R6HAG3_9BACT|nr:UDP-N-acetylmuramate--L-alanine ligase [Sunxiuqinia elliptica]TDO04918.1 UDP-N-acetylmuramate--L-alanine ligase [Sunxiuqinia elliptica]TDO64466.1 UDP-N-acetylmuramate--L-alanine ligase [Sunxiuqinia elliptica]
MIRLNDIRQVYFLGIGGIGMSALARYFKHAGCLVSGYDRTESELTRQLQVEGIVIHYDDRPEWLSSHLQGKGVLVVYTPAVPAELGERVWLEQQKFPMLKRSEVLGLICNELRCCAVAGTHGKTSVSTMLAHLLHQSSLGCTAFLGGISKNYQSNLLLHATSSWAVAEADEFDRSFLRLFSELAVITSMDSDHLDIYGNQDAIVQSFHDFVAQIKPDGALIYKKGLAVDQSRNGKIRYFSYALKEQADFYAENIQLVNEAYHFDLVYPEGRIENMELNYPGLMNVENAVAACALALLAGVAEDELKVALADYHGVKRRFDIQYRDEQYVLIDDYAHHPEELKATITSVRDMFPGRKLTGIFQPHLYSRTRDFATEFAAQLDRLDEVILLDIYPAREQPIPGVSSRVIFDQLKSGAKQLVGKEKLPEIVKQVEPGVILMMGAGDIATMVEPIKNSLQEITHV